MSLLDVIILAIVQGLTELLPVSSSAHVVVAEKLMGLDPSSPPMTLLLVMLHTGTMFAVIVYFWRQWRSTFFQSMAAFKIFARLVVFATVLTGLIGEALIKVNYLDVPIRVCSRYLYDIALGVIHRRLPCLGRPLFLRFARLSKLRLDFG